MRKTYKDRMLPEAFKKRIEKVKAQRKPGDDKPVSKDLKKSAKSPKGEKREDPGSLRSYMDHPKMKRGMKREDPKGNPAGYYDSSKKKKKKVDKSPYADGMGKKCTCDSVAEELRGLLIKEDDEVERADKKCGQSGIPDKAKCSKTTTSRSTKSKGGVSGGQVAGAVAAAAIYGGLKYGAARRQQSRNAKSALSAIKRLKAKGNDVFVASIKGASQAKEISQMKRFKGQEQNLLQQAQNQIREGYYTRQMARAQVKQSLGELTNLVPKSAARRRKANRKPRKPVTGGIANRGVTAGLAIRNR